MTDFRARCSVTALAREPIDAALDHRKHAGVRSTIASVARMIDEVELAYVPVVQREERGAQRLPDLLSAARVKKLLAR